MSVYLYYSCFGTHFVHSPNLTKKTGPTFIGGSLEVLMYSKVFQRDLF